MAETVVRSVAEVPDATDVPEVPALNEGEFVVQPLKPTQPALRQWENQDSV